MTTGKPRRWHGIVSMALVIAAIGGFAALAIIAALALGQMASDLTTEMVRASK